MCPTLLKNRGAQEDIEIVVKTGEGNVFLMGEDPLLITMCT